MDRKVETLNKVITELLVSKLEYLEDRNRNEETILKNCIINRDLIKKGLKEMASINLRITTEKSELKNDLNRDRDTRNVSRDKKVQPTNNKSISKGPVSRNKSSRKLSPSNVSENSKKTNFTSNKVTKNADTVNLSFNDSNTGLVAKTNDGKSKSKGKTLVKNNTVANSKNIN